MQTELSEINLLLLLGILKATCGHRLVLFVGKLLTLRMFNQYTFIVL